MSENKKMGPPGSATDADAATPKSAACYQNLREHQDQLDHDGVMVGVSRQALDETLAIYDLLLNTLRSSALNLDACAVAIKRGGKSNGRHVLVEDWAERARVAVAHATSSAEQTPASNPGMG